MFMRCGDSPRTGGKNKPAGESAAGVGSIVIQKRAHPIPPAGATKAQAIAGLNPATRRKIMARFNDTPGTVTNTGSRVNCGETSPSEAHGFQIQRPSLAMYPHFGVNQPPTATLATPPVNPSAETNCVLITNLPALSM